MIRVPRSKKSLSYHPNCRGEARLARSDTGGMRETHAIAPTMRLTDVI